MGRLVDVNLGKKVSGEVVVTNIGKLVSGDIDDGILDADAIFIRDGKIAEVGMKEEIDFSGADHVVDANGMIVCPSLIDTHVHLLGALTDTWLEDAFHGGVTTMIDQGSVGWWGGARPMNGAGSKVLAMMWRRNCRNFRPGGGLKVHGGAVILEERLTEKDFKEMAEAGVWVVAEVGGGGLYRTKDVTQMIGWARKYGFKIPAHFGGQAIPGGAVMGADDVISLDPDIVVHVNGGSTAPSWEDVKKVVNETKCYLEAIFNGNPKIAFDLVNYLKERDELHRLIVGSDSPCGPFWGPVPLAIMRSVVQISSLNRIPAHMALAMATGNSARAYELNTGMIEEGREADLLVIHCPVGSVGKDGLEAIEAGDFPGIPMIMVDGEVVTLRGLRSPKFNRYVKIDGVERPINTFEDMLYGPLGNPSLPRTQPGGYGRLRSE